MPRSARAVILACTVASVAALSGWYSSGEGIARGQTVPPLPAPYTARLPSDLQCRDCHEDKTDVLALPSGETLPLGVELPVLDGSPHSSVAVNPVPCTGCHQNETRYRYPHLENPAASLRDFALAVSANCQACHYPHNPYHSPESAEAPLDYTPPACVDCHGSHEIVRVEQIAENMPANCVACHTDQTVAWAQELVPARSGFGAGAEGYAGSTRCLGCHEEQFATWKETLHARLVQDPAQYPAAVVGDFGVEDPVRTFALGDVAYTIGSRWKQVYLTRTVSDTFHILPAQWNVAEATWEPYETDDRQPYHPEELQASDWRQECGTCHVTGLETASWTFNEFGIGCEGCHGPGAAHAADPENVAPFAEVDDQVCGACHSRGETADGHPFPATYKPGDVLADHFTVTARGDALWPDGSARWNHQQYMDWGLDSKMATSGDVNCTTCHAVHSAGVTPGQLHKPANELCLACHTQQKALVSHTPFHEKAIYEKGLKGEEFRCIDCHMPKLASSANDFDLRNHTFLQPDPQASVDHGGIAVMPNACNQCHLDISEGPDWAAQTVAFARAQATPVPGAFYGPGPTPTSPPPPTPMASVGQPVVKAQVETGQWIRWTLIGLAAVAGLLLIAWLFYRLRTRRTRHA
jgi:predicted CXXCH cytochrome family protein